jgi:hypothetical protein
MPMKHFKGAKNVCPLHTKLQDTEHTRVPTYNYTVNADQLFQRLFNDNLSTAVILSKMM